MSIESVNPATGERIKSFREMSVEDVGRILQEGHQAFLKWREVKGPERALKMKNASELLRKSKAQYARLMAEEMGKPLRQGEGEIEKCAWACDYFAETAERFLAPQLIKTDAIKSFVSFEPLGILLAVMPWNFPFWQVFRSAAPALMAGNSVILKHASNVSGCALAIEDIFSKAGFPAGLFRAVLVSSVRVQELIASPLVKTVTLTGSTPAGQAVAAKAGQMLKKTVLELGGSDPYIILEDAELDSAVETCVTSRITNSGQSCIAAKRFIVVEPVRKKFEEKFVQRMKAERMGDPFDQEVTIGPLARLDLRDDLHGQVKKSIKKGARLLLGGTIPDRKGAYYPPTVLTDVTKGMPACDEETFGPVAAIIAAKNEEEAIHAANDSIYGLGAAVFTSDRERGERIAREKLEAGACFVNAPVKSDPRLPFGGVKQSGYGRELSSFGIREFVNVKTVYVR